MLYLHQSEVIFINSDIHNNITQTEQILNASRISTAIEFAEWTYQKANLKFNSSFPKFPIYNNFIYWCNLGINIGSEQNKLRPVLILRSFKNSPICTVLPLTTKRLQDQYDFHIDLEELNSTVLVEQLRVVSKLRFSNPYRVKGKLVAISQNDWYKINAQIEILYRLRPLSK